MADKVLFHYANKAASAPADNKDLSVAADKTIVFKSIDYTAPAQQSAGVKIILNPSGSNQVLSAAQGDKFIMLPPGQVVNGPATVRLQLDNSNNSNAAFLGVTIYYEEI